MRTTTTTTIQVSREYGDPRVIVRMMADENGHIINDGGSRTYELESITVEIDNDGPIADEPDYEFVQVTVKGIPLRKDWNRFEIPRQPVTLHGPMKFLEVYPAPWEEIDRMRAYAERAGQPDQHGNVIAREGCDQCICGSKYWENDRCLDCNTHVSKKAS